MEFSPFVVLVLRINFEIFKIYYARKFQTPSKYGAD